MGIYDRDYARPAGARGGPPTRGGGLRVKDLRKPLLGLSITSWIILINCAVFVFDAMASKSWRVEVPMGELYPPPWWTRDTLPTISETRSFITDSRARQSDPTGVLGQFEFHPIYRADDFGRIRIRPDGSPDQVGFQRYSVMPPLKAAGHFSTGKGFRELQVWRLVLFQFLHADISHLAFNMLGLFFFGPLVERWLGGGRRYLAFYLVSGIAGALLYLTLNLLGQGLGLQLPGLLQVDMYTPLIGASAGVFGVLIASAYVAGNEIMLAFGIVPMKVRTGAYLMVGLALANLLYSGRNAGGDAAHIGGAIAGWYFIRRPYMLREFFDFFGPGRAKLRRTPGPPASPPRSGSPERARLDAILDKVHQSGLHSLTDAERTFLDSMREP